MTETQKLILYLNQLLGEWLFQKVRIISSRESLLRGKNYADHAKEMGGRSGSRSAIFF